MKKIGIVGCSGHGKVVVDIIEAINTYVDNEDEQYEVIGFYDDNYDISTFMDYPYLGTSFELAKDCSMDFEVVIAIGDNKTRAMMAERLDGKKFATLTHPSAYISSRAKIDLGTVVMANAVVNVDAEIGKHCIINSSSVIEHDVVCGDYVHISPNASLAGAVEVDDLTHIGIGASIIQGIRVGRETRVGAGAVVISNISSFVTVVGVPAKEIRG